MWRRRPRRRLSMAHYDTGLVMLMLPPHPTGDATGGSRARLPSSSSEVILRHSFVHLLRATSMIAEARSEFYSSTLTFPRDDGQHALAPTEMRKQVQLVLRHLGMSSRKRTSTRPRRRLPRRSARRVAATAQQRLRLRDERSWSGPVTLVHPLHWQVPLHWQPPHGLLTALPNALANGVRDHRLRCPCRSWPRCP